jgi:2,4-diaminopentanoate dehydrogenase
MPSTLSDTDSGSRRPLRVVQWATGNIGSRALQQVIGHPHLELVGLYAHSAEKAGRDAGELCGLGPTGVLATNDVDDIIALGADCVLYMPRTTDVDVLCRLLAAGTNVVSTCGVFHHPSSMDAEVRARVEAACAEGGASVHSTGSSPGFITEAVPLVLASIQCHLDRMTIDEFADLSQRDSPGLLFDVMGFGKPPAELDPGRVSHLRESFGPSLRVVGDALSLPLDSVEVHGEIAVTPRTVEIAAGTLEAGTLAAQRTTVSGMRDGRDLVRFRATWFCSHEIDPSWDLLSTGWKVSVEGDAPLELDIRMPIPLERMASSTPAYTANRPVNAIPFVCAATPGIRSVIDLPAILPTLT